MEKALKEFYATHTELEVIEMVLGGEYYRFEKLRKEIFLNKPHHLMRQVFDKIQTG